jgi:hypothetical protein
VSRIVLEGITKRYRDGATAVRSLDLPSDLESLHLFDPGPGDSLRRD